MSIPTKEQVGRFLAPLRGNLTIILLHDIQTKTRLSHFLLRCASLESVETTVLDTDVFYCTNIDRLAEGALSPGMTELLLLPERGFEVSSLLPLLSSKRELIIIDDLNSLYSLASEERKAHQLAILMRLLSHNARVNGSWVIATALPDRPRHQTGRPEPAVFDHVGRPTGRHGLQRRRAQARIQRPLGGRRARRLNMPTFADRRRARCRWHRQSAGAPRSERSRPA